MSAPRASSTRLRQRLAALLGVALAAALALAGAAGSPRPAAAEDGSAITVCPSCPTQTIAEALSRAEPGARIVVDGGRYPALTIDRPVALIGLHRPVIDARGHGTALDIAAPDVTIQGFAIRGTGTSHDHEDSAIRVNAARATIVDNQIDDALFGIYLKNGHGSVLRGNVVRAKPLPLGERGDGIRVWYSNGVTVEDNVVHKGRDVILWFSHDAVVRHNTVDDSRYGLHLMYSDRTRIEENALRSNLVGLYIMYSRDDLVRANAITDNRGPSGLGIGLKAVDDGRLEANRIVGNQIGIQVDESPHDLGAGLTIAGNVVAYNGVGIAFLPNVRRNTVVGNDFLDNMEQVAILGGGSLRDMTWTEAGRGNYWSDYAGYDADGDGVGDLPYQSRHLFESLMDQHEQLRLFLFSPAATAIDFAARAFPEVRPETKLVDGAPLMHPVAGAGLAPAPRLPGTTRLALGSISFIVSIGGLAMVRALRRRPVPQPNGPAPEAGRPLAPAASPSTGGAHAILVTALTKRYGSAVAVDQATFQVARGEALAIWGPNGAGKTTVLRCLLGIADYAGDVTVDGLRPDRDGRAIRQRIGFVPQELPSPPLTVREFTRFIATLKGVPPESAEERLQLLGIGDQLDKAIGALSGGMRQRLALALALLGSPSILLLDEPTANLDARGRAELLALLGELKRQGMTIVFSSHRPEDVLTLADRILLMERGVVRGETTPQRFLETLDAEARLILYLDHDHVPVAVDALDRLGLPAEASGSVLAVPLEGRSKGGILGALARAGVVVHDFELERRAWTGQSS